MIRAPKGVSDILPPKASWYSCIEDKARKFFSLYGYNEIRMPTFESTQLFLRSVGEETDVGKQMYTFEDKGGRSISLRPEGTAGIARAYIEHKLYGKGKEWKVYYAGPMFRYEKPQAGRLREFYQIGIECFGEKDPLIDVEIVEMAYHFLNDELGLDNIRIQINSIGCKDCRKSYIEEKLKAYLKEHLNDLCSTCRRRFYYNPLRVLDCKRETCKNALKGVPKIKDFLCLSCKEHFDSVKEGLCKLDVPYNLDPYLVRGLDYYTRTIFEITSPYIGSQDAICAGGRYDDLIEELEGPSIPAMGFAIGVERLLLSLKRAGVDLPLSVPMSIFVATVGKGSVEEGMKVARKIRSQGFRVKVNFTQRGLSAQLKQANKEGFLWVLIVGEEEIEKKKYILKSMESSKQQYVDAENVGVVVAEKIFKNEI